MKTIEGNKYMLIVASVMALILISLPISAIDNNISAIGNNETIENMSNTTIYRSLVDQDYGFYRVIDVTAHKPAQYVNNTLTIYVGDTVIWENDATPDEPLTIISEQKLWENRGAYLRWNYQKFSYTFNQSGDYSVYISEYPRKTHQKIIVKNIPGTINVTSAPTIILAENPVVTLTENPIVINNTSSKAPVKVNVIPIETMMAIAGLIALVVYIYLKKR